VKNKFKFLSLSATGGKAQFTMMLPFGGSQLALGDAMRESILAQIRLAATEVGKQTESLGLGVVSQWGAQPAPLEFDTVDELLPKETDYFYKDYRAISATLAPCYALDFSTPGVLEASVPLLNRQTVYKDHYFYSVDAWVGVVSETTWDAKGDHAGGIPGITAKLKLDSKKDPMLVRGVAMDPPAVHSASATVFFEFEFSHPKLVEEGRFWQLLMEEVEGELVRLIITKILGYWELSLVFQGAQEENKQLPANDVVDDDGEAGMNAKRKQKMSADAGTTIQSQRSETVKLSAELRKLLGIPETVGEDVPDAVLLPALTQMGGRVEAGDTLLANGRAECLRVATLAECGEGEALPEPIATMINKASATELSSLTRLYEERAAAKLTQTCTKCGTQMSPKVRSSVEQSPTQPEMRSQSYVPNGADSLHG
jgi:hypothetical protein